MPRIKRWFPVSHDINADPEVWAMRRTVGEKSLSIWLEILSIADRNESELPGDYDQLVRSIAGKCQATVRTVSQVFEFGWSKMWLDSQPTLRVRNYGKYHISRDAKQIPRRKRKASLPSEPSEPSEPKLPTEAYKSAQLLSDLIFKNFPNRTAPTEAILMGWAAEADRINRIDGHPWERIEAVVRWAQSDDFWRANILSMSTLRKQWNKLVAKMESGNDKRASEPKGFQSIRDWRNQRQDNG